MSRFASFLLVLCAMVYAAPAGAQVSAASERPFNLYAYGTATVVDDEQTYGKAVGEGGGIFAQRNRWLGLDARGYIVNNRVALHTFLGELGPRVQYPVWRLRPYAEFMGGLGHSGYHTPQNTLGSGYGLAYAFAFGTDLRLTHRFEWRVVDVQYTHIYTGPGVSPLIGSTGVVFRIF